MAVDTPSRPADQSVTSLAAGIVSDFQELLKQQLRLTRQEIAYDLRKAKEASFLMAAGGAVSSLGAIPLLMGLALMLWQMSSPTPDPAKLPLWASFLLIGALVVGAGLVTLLLGKRKIDRLAPLQETAQAMKENLEWQTNPK
jgi:hypothetical protein